MYGSQLGYDSVTGTVYPLPIMDPDNVDKRRSGVGLDSLGELAIVLEKIKGNSRKCPVGKPLGHATKYNEP